MTSPPVRNTNTTNHANTIATNNYTLGYQQKWEFNGVSRHGLHERKSAKMNRTRICELSHQPGAPQSWKTLAVVVVESKNAVPCLTESLNDQKLEKHTQKKNSTLSAPAAPSPNWGIGWEIPPTVSTNPPKNNSMLCSNIKSVLSKRRFDESVLLVNWHRLKCKRLRVQFQTRRSDMSTMTSQSVRNLY